MEFSIRYRKPGKRWEIELHTYSESAQLRCCHLLICGYEVEVSSRGGAWTPYIPRD